MTIAIADGRGDHVQRFNSNNDQFLAPNVASIFEDLCLVIFRNIWKDQLATKNGRSGQAQNGVDIFGREDGQTVAVQCKKKDLSLNSHLTEKEILEEIALAEDFEPSLSYLVIATTDARNVNLQKFVRKLGAKREAKGLFGVKLQAWDDLRGRIGEFPDDILPVFYPQYLITVTEKPDKEKTIQEIDSGSLQAKSSMDISDLAQLTGSLTTDVSELGTAILSATVNDEYNEELDHAKDLLDKNRYSEALAYLLKIKNRIWGKANKNIRFRILTNMAAAQHHLNQIDESAENFLAAYEVKPEDEKAQSNRAFAYILKEDYDSAIKAASELIDTSPKNYNAYAIKIQAEAHNSVAFDTILNSIPEELQTNDQIIYAIAAAAKTLGLQKDSSEWFEKAIEVDQDGSDPFALSYFAGNIVEGVIANNKFSIRGNLAEEDKTKLHKAVDIFTKAWKQLPDRNDKSQATEILFNLTTAYRLLGDLEKAQSAIDELLDLAPDEKNYIITSAAIAHDRKDFVREEEIMLSLAATDPEAHIKLAESLSRQGKDEEASIELTKFLKNNPQRDELWEEANYIQFDIYVKNKQFEKAEKLADEIVKDGSKPLMGGILTAKIYRLEGKIDEAATVLRQTEALIDKDKPNEWIIELAQEAYALEYYKLAVSMYEIVVDSRVDTTLTRRYLHSLYESRQYEKVISIAEPLRKLSGAVRDITQFEWAAYQELQDLPHAKEVLQAYISDNPNDDDAKLRLALIDMRSGNVKDVDTYLMSEINISKLDLFSVIQLSNLYQLRKQPEKSLHAIYAARRLFPNEADAHSSYISTFLSLEESKMSKTFRPTEVTANTAIKYDGGQFVIENEYEPDGSKDEISLQEATKRGFIGKKKGDEITISKNSISGEVKVKIVEVQSKYVYAFQNTLQNYEKQFIDRNDIMGAHFDGENFEPLLKQIDESHKHIQNVEQLYKEGKLTIDLFAKLANRSYLEVFYGLRAMPESGIRAAKGTDDEAEETRGALIANPVLVADISALVTLYELGVSTKQIGIEKLVITQTTKDLIVEEIAKSDGMGQKVSMTLYKRGDQYFREKITAKTLRARSKHLQDLAKWIEKNTRVEAHTQEQIDFFDENNEQLQEIMSTPQMDTLRLSIGKNRVLYCDDAGFKDLAKSFGVSGVWTQALLAKQVQDGKISGEKYPDLIIKLAQANYHHTGVNPVILMRAAEQSKWIPGDEFISALKALTRKETTMQSLVIVSVNFLYELYKKPLPVEKSYLVQQLISEVSKNHDIELFLQVLDRAIAQKFRLIPNYIKEINDIIVIWRSLHGL